MKKSIFLTVALFAFISITSQLLAQETAVLKTRTKSNNANERTAGYDLKTIKCRVIPSETGCTIVFDGIAAITGGAVAGKRTNEIDAYQRLRTFSVSSSDNAANEVKSPRDVASGLATSSTRSLNREASAPSLSEIVVTKSETQAIQSSGTGAGKASFKEFTVTKRYSGKTTKISCPDGECGIPLDDCPNGTCDLVCSWSWGATNTGSSGAVVGSGLGRCSVNFLLEIQDGVCTDMAINEKGISGSSSGTTKK